MERSELITELVSVFGGIKRSMHGKTYQCKNGRHLSIGQLMVLFAIRHHGPISGQELATRLSMTPGGISQLVDSLVEDGFVVRTPKSADRRVHELTLSAQGTAQVKTIETERFAMIRQATTDLSDAELTQLIASLQKIQQAIQSETT